jgi:etoposide-induced 2.4 mRNA
MSATLHTSIGAVASSFAAGVRDAISFHNVVIFLMTSRTIRNRALQCFLLNGAVFLGSIVLAEYVVIPFLQHLLSADQDTAEIGSIVHSTFTILYQCLWIYPIYAVSFILNSIWYQDIAEYAFVIHGLKSKKVDWSFARWLQSMSEEIYRSLLVGGYFVQITLVSFVPYIGKPVFGLYLCWLYALYSFEYKWSMEQWDLERKLTYFEMRWPYFAGFGAF